MIHAGQTVAVVAQDGQFRPVIGGKTVTAVPRTTTSEIHRYRAYATQIPQVGPTPGEAVITCPMSGWTPVTRAEFGELLPFSSSWLARELERSAHCWQSSPATPLSKTKPNAVSMKPLGPARTSRMTILAAAQTWACIEHSTSHVSAQDRIRPRIRGLGPEPDLSSSGPVPGGSGRSKVRTWVGYADGFTDRCHTRPDLPLCVRLLNFAPHSPDDRSYRGLSEGYGQIAASQSSGLGCPQRPNDHCPSA